MGFIHATYNMLHNSIDVTTFDGYDNPLEYATLYLDGCMQIWIDAEDSLELW